MRLLIRVQTNLIPVQTGSSKAYSTVARTGFAVEPKLKQRIERYRHGEAAGHLLRRAQQRAVDLFVEEVGEDGPTPRQFAVLLSVFQNPGMSQTALVEASAIDRSTLTEILRRMIARGLVSRRRTKADQRANALTLTPEGEAILASAFEAAMRSQDRILDPVDPGHRGLAMQVLAALAGCDAADRNSPDADA